MKLSRWVVKTISARCSVTWQCRHHSLYVQETGSGLRGSSTRISCQPQPEATSESRTLGISEVVGGSNASAHGELSYSRALGSSQKIDQHLHGDGASLNQFLCDEYKLHRFGYVLEVPLDNTVTKKLRAWGKERNRVRRGQFSTFSIKQLKKADSDQYQELAQACAEERGIPRGRLDIELWEPQRQRRGEQLASQRLK